MDLGKLIARAYELAASPALYPAMERLADTRVPEPLRGPFYSALARLWDVDLGEVEGPLERYPTLGAFFGRRLVEGARPVDPDPAAIVSPADGVLQAAVSFGPGEDPLLDVKGAAVRLGRVLGDYRTAIDGGGHAFVVYLSPRDYHRVHAPVAGRVRSWQAIPGTRLPVNRIGVRACPEVLARNERTIVEIERPDGSRLLLVLVAAFGVARTRLVFVPPGDVKRRSGSPPLEPPEHVEVARGAEIGSFNLGSTVVAIWPADGNRLVWLGCTGPIRVGQGIARPAGRDGG